MGAGFLAAPAGNRRVGRDPEVTARARRDAPRLAPAAGFGFCFRA
jgi:hypothetical protein